MSFAGLGALKSPVHPEVEAALLRGLNYPKSEVRSACASAVGKLSLLVDFDATSALKVRLEQEAEPSTQAVLLDAMTAIVDNSSVAPESSVPTILLDATFVSSVIGLLKSTASTELQLAALRFLSAVDRVVDDAQRSSDIGALRSEEAGDRMHAIHCLKKQTVSATQAIAKLLDDDDLSVRLVAINALGYDSAVLDREIAQQIIDQLSAGDSMVQLAAMETIRRHGGDLFVSAVPTLTKLLRSCTGPSDHAAIRALQSIGEPAAPHALATLRAYLNSKDKELRRLADDAIRQITAGS